MTDPHTEQGMAPPTVPRPVRDDGGPRSAMAVVALLLGLVGLLSAPVLVGLPLAIAAVVVGHITLRRIRRADPQPGGRGLAIAGLVAGYVGIVLAVGASVAIGYFSHRAYQKSLPPPELRERMAEIKKAGPKAGYEHALQLCAGGDQAAAEDLLDLLIEEYAEDQRLLFFRAACKRSRWGKRRAHALFRRVIALGRESPEGICSRLVIDLDGRTYVDRNFERLQKLVEDNPEDPLILWLLCIECREHRRNELGAQSYKRLSVFFDPGPVLGSQSSSPLRSV